MTSSWIWFLSSKTFQNWRNFRNNFYPFPEIKRKSVNFNLNCAGVLCHRFTIWKMPYFGALLYEWHRDLEWSRANANRAAISWVLTKKAKTISPSNNQCEPIRGVAEKGWGKGGVVCLAPRQVIRRYSILIQTLKGELPPEAVSMPLSMLHLHNPGPGTTDPGAGTTRSSPEAGEFKIFPNIIN